MKFLIVGPRELHMAQFYSGGIKIAFDDIGREHGGRPVLLVHGFASNRKENWQRLGWYGAFERRRLRTIAMDCRGHGESDKPHEASAYSREVMTRDVLALMDHLDLPSVNLLGYSMGARIALATAMSHGSRIKNLIIGGVGARLLDPSSHNLLLAEAMEQKSPETISTPLLRSFRQFADEQGEDRAALAACARASNPPFDDDAFQKVSAAVLVVAGERDELAGPPDALASRIHDGRAVVLPGCDHFSAIPHGLFKASVFDFLDGTMP